MKIKPTIADEFEILDRGDGMTVTFVFKNGSSRRVSMSDETASELATNIDAIQSSDDRPVDWTVSNRTEVDSDD